MVDKALEAGASKSSENQDNGWMYQRGFQDPDGHLWEILYMDMSSVPPN
jgi:predicted lactoylglutathione lyase